MKKKSEKSLLKEEKKAEKKREKKKAEIIHNTIEILPLYDYDDELEAFHTSRGYMDIMNVEPRDRENQHDDEISYNMITMTRFYRLYSPDVKFVTMNFPISTEKQQGYFQMKIKQIADVVRQKWLRREVSELVMLEENVKRREFYMMVFAESKEEMIKNRSDILAIIGTGRTPLISEMSGDKKIEIVRKLCNLNTLIDANNPE